MLCAYDNYFITVVEEWGGSVQESTPWSSFSITEVLGSLMSHSWLKIEGVSQSLLSSLASSVLNQYELLWNMLRLSNFSLTANNLQIERRSSYRRDWFTIPSKIWWYWPPPPPPKPWCAHCASQQLWSPIIL